jgi:TatD DNase family protein
MIDSHTHLDSCEPPNEELVAAALEAGVDHIVTVGMDVASCRSALVAAQAFPQVYAAVGRHPNSATGFDPGTIAELRAFAEHERCVAIGETGLDFYRDSAPRADQERAFEAQIALAAETGKPLIIHTRAAEEPTLAMLREHADGVTVILHCFSMPEHLDEVLDRDWIVSFAGNVTYPRNEALAAAAARVPAERLLVETDAPYLTPQAVRKHRNQPAYVLHTARFVAEQRGVSLDELDRDVSATAARVFGW